MCEEKGIGLNKHVYLECPAVMTHVASRHDACVTSLNHVVVGIAQGLLRVSGTRLANKGLVNVNNKMVPGSTLLVDGDVIFRTDELVDIN